MPRRSSITYETEMSVVGHLDELRRRLIICVLAIFATTILVGLPLAKPFVSLLIHPLRSADFSEPDRPMTVTIRPDGALVVKDPPTSETAKNTSAFRLDFVIEDEAGNAVRTIPFGPRLKQNLYFFGPFDLFFIVLKAAFLLGVALAIPIWLYQLWAFVSPAFTKSEMRLVRPVFYSAVLLFPIGAAFAYFGMSFVLKMLLTTFHVPGLEPRLGVERYTSFVMMFMLVFGCVFETPVVVVLLVRMGLVTTKFLRSTRQYAILVIAILSAVLTPADPFTMVMMMIPLLALYEASIWISVVIERRVRESEATDEEASSEAVEAPESTDEEADDDTA